MDGVLKFDCLHPAIWNEVANKIHMNNDSRVDTGSGDLDKSCYSGYVGL